MEVVDVVEVRLGDRILRIDIAGIEGVRSTPGGLHPWFKGGCVLSL